MSNIHPGLLKKLKKEGGKKGQDVVGHNNMSEYGYHLQSSYSELNDEFIIDRHMKKEVVLLLGGCDGILVIITNATNEKDGNVHIICKYNIFNDKSDNIKVVEIDGELVTLLYNEYKVGSINICNKNKSVIPIEDEICVSDSNVLLGGSDNSDDGDNKHNDNDIVASDKESTLSMHLHNMPPLDESLYDLYDSIDNQRVTNVLEAIKYWVDKQPNKVAYHWIDKADGKVTKSYTYGELWKKVESIAYHLINEWEVKGGNSVFIVYPPGLEFMFAHFGCMLAGCVSVPVYPPIPGRALKKGVEKLKLLQESCKARIALTSSKYNKARRAALITSFKTKWPKLDWHTTDTIKWKPKYAINKININPNSLAFLQYTSGSTGDPKGVMILHKNYLHNVLTINRCAIPEGTSNNGFCWLPQYHDMGLIGCYSAVICGGGTQYCMSPITFLQNPSIWIHCLSRYKCNTTTAPNFAFELVVRKWHEPKDGQKVNLNHVYYIGNGAEPVRLETLNKFYALFEKYGLPRGVIHPQYGLAETCVFACIDHHILTHTDIKGIQRVCSGNIDMVSKLFNVDIRIINPETSEELNDNEEGEIIISSQSIAAGYMNRSELSKEVFEFQLPNNSDNNRTYLRTGDLGMIVKPDHEWSIANPDRHPLYGQDDALLEEELNQRHLVITGRIKDLIILNGRNYYPQDIELCVEHALTDERLVRSGCVVATSIEWNNEESFGIVCELRTDILKEYINKVMKNDKKIKKERILKEICIEIIKEIQDEFGVNPAMVALIKEKTIPKTTSGKVRRKATAAALLAGDQLKLIYVYNNVLDKTDSIIDKTFSIKVSSPSNIQLVPLDTEQNSDDKIQTALNNNQALPTPYHTFESPLSLDLIKTQVRNIVKGELMLESNDNKTLDDNAPFSDMGFVSMNAVNASEKLEAAFEIELDAIVLYSYPTIKQISEFIFAIKSGLSVIVRSPLSRMQYQSSVKSSLIAIVGISCRLPADISSPLEFWLALSHDMDLIQLSKPRSDMFSDKGGFLSQNQIELFDNEFFCISKMEAQHMDPQQRLLLTTAWKSCFMADIDSKDVLNETRTGVYIGMSGTEYQLDKDAPTSLMATSVHNAIAANRISYVFGLNGPSMVIDTACSSSLVALVQACSDLKHNKCDAAFVGGINIMHNLQSTEILSKSGFLSPRYRCHTFDQSADGYVRSEGCVMLFVKRLEDAEVEELPILAVIKGGSVASDGRTMSLTAPNARMQAQVIQDALDDAKLNADAIDFIELHGTGTALGDPIEMSGIQMSLSPATSPKRHQNPLILSSAKSTVGHLEAAAGVTGILKALLQLINKQIPRNIHLKKFNNKLNMKGCVMPHTLNNYQNDIQGYKLNNRIENIYCGVSSFGFGGTLAHVIMSNYIDNNNNIPEYLQYDINNEIRPVFVFSGQGGLDWFNNKYIQDLYINNEIFHQSINKCCELMNNELNPYTLLQLLNIKSNNKNKEDKEELNIKNNKDILLEYAQVCIFVIQYGLVELWKSMNIVPSVVIGHSVGEICGALCCGIFTLEEACKLILYRCNIMSECSQKNNCATGMLVLMSSSKELLITACGKACDTYNLSIACYNASTQIVLSGELVNLKEFISYLESSESLQDIKHKLLKTTGAFHSKYMENAYKKMLKCIDIFVGEQKELLIPFVSTVTGKLVKSVDIFTSKYWAEQIINPVLFSSAIDTVIKDFNNYHFLEIGVGKVLTSLIKKGYHTRNLKVMSSEEVLSYSLNNNTMRFKIIKTYQPTFEWTSMNVFPLVQYTPQETSIIDHTLIGYKYATATANSYGWNKVCNVHDDVDSYICDHVIGSEVVVPGAMFVCMSIIALCKIPNGDKMKLTEIQFKQFLPINKSVNKEVKTIIDVGGCNINIETGDSKTHYNCNFTMSTPNNVENNNLSKVKHIVISSCNRGDIKQSYDIMSCMGMQFGKCFQLIEEAWFGKGVAWTKLKLPLSSTNYQDIPHPTLIDGCFQSTCFTLLRSIDSNILSRSSNQVYIPYHCKAIEYNLSSFVSSHQVFCYIKLVYIREDEYVFDMWITQVPASENVDDIPIIMYFNEFCVRNISMNAPHSFWYSLSLDNVAHNTNTNTNTNFYPRIQYFTSDVTLANSYDNYVFWDASKNEHKSIESDIDILVFILDISTECVDNLLLFIQWIVPQYSNLVTNLLICTQNYLQNESKLLSQGAAVGFIRSLQNEYMDSFKSIKLIDVHEDVDQLSSELIANVFELPDTELSIKSSNLSSISALRVKPFNITDVDENKQQPSHSLSTTIADKICIIIGGTKGIGLRIGAWLITQGINTICLISRSGRINNDDQWIINEMKEYNKDINIIIKSCDIMNMNECQAIFNELKLIGNIGGIIYGAAVWSDGLIMNMTNESLHKAMDPKVIGTYNVHRITIDDIEIKESLEFFVVLSSIASIVGAPGLGNYNAGNTYQELLMQYRVNVLNVCGSVLNLGGIIDVGHMVDDKSLTYNPEYMLLSSDVFISLQYLIVTQSISEDDVHNLTSNQLVVHKFNPFNVLALKQFTSKFDAIVVHTNSNIDLSYEEIVVILKDTFASFVVDESQVDIFKQYSEFGIDSLSINGIINNINSKLGTQLQVATLFQFNTIDALAVHLSSDDPIKTNQPSNIEEQFEVINNNNCKVMDSKQISYRYKNTLQIIWWLFAMMILGVCYLPVAYIMRESIEEYGANSFFKIGCALLLSSIIYGLELIIFTLCCKWLILGRSQVGYYRLWSLYFIRWWCVSSLVNMVNRFVGFFLQETALYSIWLRLLGAQIGKYVIIDTTRLRDVDLLTIGDESVIERESRISCHRFVHLIVNGVNDVYLCLEEVKIGSQCILDYKSTVQAGDIVADNHKVLNVNASNKYESLSVDKLEEVSIGRRLAIFSLSVAVSQMIGMLIYLATWCLCISISLWPANYVYDIDEVLGITFLLSCLPILMTFGFSCCTIIIKWSLISKFDNNTSYLYTSWFMFRFWLANRYITTFSQIQMLWNSMSIISLVFSKLIGLNTHYRVMHVISNFSVASNLIKLGDNVWIGYSAVFIPWSYSGSKIHFNSIEIGDECVFGESCVILGNVKIGNYAVIGPNSVLLPSTIINKNTIYMGSSEIMKRPSIEKSNTNNVYVMFQFKLILLTILSYVILFICSYPVAWFWNELILHESIIDEWTFTTIDPKHWKLIPMQQWGIIFITLLIAIEMFIYTIIISIIIRMIADRTNNEDIETFYNTRVLLWLWEGHLKSLSLVAAENADSMLINGTVIMNILMRIFGAHIGKNVFCVSRFLLELDMLDIASNCIIDEAMILPHTVSGIKTTILDQHLIKCNNNCIFEVDSRPLPAVKLDSNCTVKYASVILKGEEIQNNNIKDDYIIIYGNPSKSTSFKTHFDLNTISNDYIVEMDDL